MKRSLPHAWQAFVLAVGQAVAPFALPALSAVARALYWLQGALVALVLLAWLAVFVLVELCTAPRHGSPKA